MNANYFDVLKLAILPITLTAALVLLEKYTRFGRLSYVVRQIIIGILFGAVAIYGTERGVNIGIAQINARDAAPLCAGMLFGGPAGIIAGCIGGIERWFAVYWGLGTFTRVACSVSTIVAGFYAALLRRFLFEGQKPRLAMSIFVSIVMEVFHITMVWLTNINSSREAFEVIRACTGPMLTANAIAFTGASVLAAMLSNESEQMKKEARQIAHKMQVRLLAVTLVGYLLTTTCIYIFQTGIAESNTTALLKMNLRDIQKDITETGGNNLMTVARIAANEMGLDLTYVPLKAKADRFGFSEINVVNSNGIIIASTNPDYVGFDMHSGSQSAEFLCLLEGEKEYLQDFMPSTSDPNRWCKYAGIAKRNGFLQFCYDDTRFHEELADSVREMASNRHIGRTGFIAILNSKGEFVSDLSEYVQGEVSYDDKTVEGLKKNEIKEYTLFETKFSGVPYYTMYAFSEGYTIVALQTVDEVNISRNVGLYLYSFMLVLVFAALYGIIYSIIRQLVVRNILSVNRSLAQITAGNLEERVDVRGTEEFSILSDDINSTVDTLKCYIAEAKARIDSELDLAHKIQASSLPGIFPPFPSRTEVDLYACMNTAREVGGDIYDFYWISKNHLAILVADVSGKGIPAALFMMTAKAIISDLSESGLDVAEVFTRTNDKLCAGNEADMFVTAWMAVVDVRTGHVEYANAGHNPPLVCHTDGTFEYIKSKPGFILAGMEGIKYKKQEFDLEPGSVIFAYTDGVVEAVNSANELYGEDRLRNCLNAHVQEDMQTLCGSVEKDMSAFVGEAAQFDDITMLALRLNHYRRQHHE